MMMRSLILRGLILLVGCMLPMAAMAEPEPSAEAPKEDKADKPAAKSMKPVAKALANMEVFNATPDYKAKFYIYLESAGWCGPCCKEMPEIVKAYPAMKSKKVEIILVGADRTQEAAKNYLERFKAEFPGVMGNDPKVMTLPGYTRSQGIPHATFVDDKGRVIESDHGSIVLRWESIIKQKPAKADKKNKKAARGAVSGG